MHSGSVPKQEVICAILNKKEYKNTGLQNQIKSEAAGRYFYIRFFLLFIVCLIHPVESPVFLCKLSQSGFCPSVRRGEAHCHL